MLDSFTVIRRLKNSFIEAFKNEDFKRAISIGEKIIKIYKENNNVKNINYAKELFNLASAYFEEHEYIRCINIYTNLLELIQEIDGKGLFYSYILNSLAICYNYIGELKKSEECFKRCISIYNALKNNNIIEQDNVDYVNTLYNTGNNYFDMGIYSKAEHYLKSALKLSKVNTIDYIDILNSIGYVYEEKSNKQAENYFEQANIMLERLFGNQSPEYLSNIYYTANYYKDSGLNEKAIEKYKIAIDIIKKTIGENNPCYAEAIDNLAIVFMNKKDYENALKLNQKSVDIIKNLFGEEDIYYANYLNVTAHIYYIMGKYKEAEERYISVLNIFKSNIGVNSNNYIITALLLAKLYRITNQHEKAIDFTNYILANIQKNNMFYKDCLFELAKNYIAENDAIGLRSVYEKITEIDPELSFDAMLLIVKED